MADLQIGSRFLIRFLLPNTEISSPPPVEYAAPTSAGGATDPDSRPTRRADLSSFAHPKRMGEGPQPGRSHSIDNRAHNDCEGCNHFRTAWEKLNYIFENFSRTNSYASLA